MSKVKSIAHLTLNTQFQWIVKGDLNRFIKHRLLYLSASQVPLILDVVQDISSHGHRYMSGAAQLLKMSAKLCYAQFYSLILLLSL